MAPKGHRDRPTGLIRTHSRGASASKLGLNLYFTQKDPTQPRQPEKTRKNGHLHEPNSRAASPFSRAHNGVIKEPGEPIATSKRAPQTNHKAATKSKANFRIASSGDDDDDDDGWVSTSGADTPNLQTSESELDEEASTPVHQSNGLPPHWVESQIPESNPAPTETLSRVDTARPSDYDGKALASRLPNTAPATPVTIVSPIHTRQPLEQEEPRLDNKLRESRSEVSSPRSPRPISKRYSVTRPPSTHSINSRGEHTLHHHPLIRGQSHGYPSLVTKPTPLAPLTVTSDVAATTYDSETSTPSSIHMSPSSSPGNTSHLRRTSVSSARSVATLPALSSVREQPRYVHDRTRTLSTISATSSSSAALSSLAHLPAGSRPSTPQTVVFFPPHNPILDLAAMHPLLPPPYLNPHLTVLARRNPLRESFDRVTSAKQRSL